MRIVVNYALMSTYRSASQGRKSAFLGWLSLAIVMAWTPSAAVAGIRLPVPWISHRNTSGNRSPYLPIIGTPRLQFEEIPAPLPPGPPPSPFALPTPAAHSTSEPVDMSKDVTPAPPPTEPTVISTTTVQPPELSRKRKPSEPVALLPDEGRREIRPEDVLPFFQLPGSNMNQLPTPPASSATYIQK